MSSPEMWQSFLVGCIFFLVFSAYYTLQGYASILLTPQLASESLSTLYGVFTLSCFFAPSVVDRVGPKRALSLGVLGYCAFSACAAIYAALGPWSAPLVVAGGAFNGLGAAVLWTAQGRLMLDIAASDETREVGAHFGVFWAFFNASAIFGGLATFFYFSRTDDRAGVALFLAFTALIALGGVFTSFIKVPESTKCNGNTTRVWETLGPTLRLFATRRAALLGPLFFYSGYCQPYQLNGFGDRFFKSPVVGIELALFYAASIAGGFRAGAVLDSEKACCRKKPLSRRAKAKRALTVFFVLTAAPYALAFHLELDFREDRQNPVGFGDAPIAWLSPTIVFMLWGFSDSYIQAYAYWLIDQLYDDGGSERSRAIAYYKFVQSAGYCVGFALLPANRCPFQLQLILNVACAALGTFLAFFALPPQSPSPPSSPSLGDGTARRSPLLLQDPTAGEDGYSALPNHEDPSR